MSKKKQAKEIGSLGYKILEIDEFLHSKCVKGTKSRGNTLIGHIYNRRETMENRLGMTRPWEGAAKKKRLSQM